MGQEVQSYKRKITYFYQHHNGNIGSTAGFLKLEIRGEKVKIIINIQEPPGLPYKEASLYFYHEAGDHLAAIKVGKVESINGMLTYQNRTDWQQIFDTGRDLYTFDGVAVVYNDSHYYIGDFQDKSRKDYALVYKQGTKEPAKAITEKTEDTDQKIIYRPGTVNRTVNSESNILKNRLSPQSEQEMLQKAEKRQEPAQETSQKLGMDKVSVNGESRSEESGKMPVNRESQRESLNEILGNNASQKINPSEILGNKENQWAGMKEKSEKREPQRDNLNKAAEEKERQGISQDETAKQKKQPESKKDVFEKCENCPYHKKRMEQKENVDAFEKMLAEYPKLPMYGVTELFDCVRIHPKDIGKLDMRNWKLGVNSFLTHGYYTYQYLLLGKMHFDNGAEKAIIGVPGVYSNREKYLANMFGFEQFIPIKKTGVKTGEFGYWIVEISPYL